MKTLLNKIGDVVKKPLLYTAAALAIYNPFYAQSKTDPTPITDIGDMFRTEEISLTPIHDASYWNGAISKQEKETTAQELVNWSIEQMQGQNFTGTKTWQSFLNITGIANPEQYVAYELGSSGFKYDPSHNGKGNAPFRIVIGKDMNGNTIEELAILTGDDPLDRGNYSFFNSSTGNKLEIGQDIDPNQPLSINSVGYIHSDFDGKNYFGFIQDFVKFNSNGSLETMKGATLRNSPNKSLLNLISPNDTTIIDTTGEDLDLMGDKYGAVLITTDPEKGKDFEFEVPGGGKITGGIYVDKVISFDTLNISPDKKLYTINKKTLVNLIEKDTLTDLFSPNGKVYEHLLKKDSVYQKITVDKTTGVESEESLEKRPELYQNYPNPFNPTTTIKFAIPQDVKHETSNTTLKIYDTLGREVKTLINEPLDPGEYELKFDASDLPSGVYFYQLTSGSHTQTRKMMLLK